MPFLLCPGCGKCDLVPLAFSEFILDDLSARGQLDGIMLEQYPGGLSFVLCGDCDEVSGNDKEPFQSGTSVRLVDHLPEACQKLNSRVAVDGGESMDLTKAIRCYSKHYVYVAHFSGVDVCLLHDWLLPLRPAGQQAQDP